MDKKPFDFKDLNSIKSYELKIAKKCTVSVSRSSRSCCKISKKKTGKKLGKTKKEGAL